MHHAALSQQRRGLQPVDLGVSFGGAGLYPCSARLGQAGHDVFARAAHLKSLSGVSNR